MGLLDKVKTSATNQKLTFENDELQFLLKLIADSKFEGKDVQVVYATAVKLQKLLVE
tara:strand:+ start:465 stop:635 length:171 start_codon:yes stop_codon:yes gene_type:complete